MVSNLILPTNSAQLQSKKTQKKYRPKQAVFICITHIAGTTRKIKRFKRH